MSSAEQGGQTAARYGYTGTKLPGTPQRPGPDSAWRAASKMGSCSRGLRSWRRSNLRLAHKGRIRMVGALLAAPGVRSHERESRTQAQELVDAFGLGPWADALTVELSTGMRRICDLMVQVAAEPRLLLLDEPTAGVAQREAEAFGPLVRGIAEKLGCSVLIIEHDMPMLMGLCDRVYAMETVESSLRAAPTRFAVTRG